MGVNASEEWSEGGKEMEEEEDGGEDVQQHTM